MFGKFIKDPSDSFVCINLGNYYIKGLIVENGIITNYFIKENKDLSAVLKEIWQQKKIATNRVKLSVKNPSCLARYFPFPKMEKKKLKQALFYELNKYIPFSPQDVYFDFHVLTEINPKEIFLLLAVAKKDFIDKILSIFDKEKLDVHEISLDSICLANFVGAVCKESKDINSCVLDIGHSFSTLTILKKEVPFLTRDLEFKTKDVFDVVSRVKNLPLLDIDKWVSSSGGHSEFLEVIRGSLSGLCKEAKSSFDYFEVNKGERIEKMYIAGGLSSVAGVGDFLKENLEVEVSVLDNLNSFNVSFSDDNFNQFKNGFTAAFGLTI
ncbi:MAG: pilus assembly protein PilM [Candidatus Omnitrophica bacterium]|nr:pilus assembly protein PilM [Candidatus Omnitrophota bacterium]